MSGRIGPHAIALDDAVRAVLRDECDLTSRQVAKRLGWQGSEYAWKYGSGGELMDVRASIASLVRRGLVIRSGHWAGDRRQAIYRLAVPAILTVDMPPLTVR